MTANGPRPGGVTLVGILLLVFGVLYIISSVFALFNETMRQDLGIIWILVSLVVGLIYLLVSKGIFNGNRGSRLLVGIVTVINLIGGILALFNLNTIAQGIITILVSLIILVLLYGRNARVYFA